MKSRDKLSCTFLFHQQKTRRENLSVTLKVNILKQVQVHERRLAESSKDHFLALRSLLLTPKKCASDHISQTNVWLSEETNNNQHQFLFDFQLIMLKDIFKFLPEPCGLKLSWISYYYLLAYANSLIKVMFLDKWLKIANFRVPKTIIIKHQSLTAKLNKSSLIFLLFCFSVSWRFLRKFLFVKKSTGETIKVYLKTLFKRHEQWTFEYIYFSLR